MTVREPSLHDNRPHLTGWKLVIALIVIAIVAILTLWITQSPEAVIIVAAPLLIVLGADRYRG